MTEMIPIQNFQPPEHDNLLGCPSGSVEPIEFWPSPVLSGVSQTVDEFDEDLDKLVACMATTMYSVGGVGLSAIQIGIPCRVFICDIFNGAPPDKKRPPSQLLIAVNPEIGWTSEEKVRLEEGCLSFPSLKESIERPAVVGLRGYSRKGKPFALRAGGFLGRVIQHEMDHLDGVSFTARMKPFQRQYVMKKMKKFKRGVENGTIQLGG